LIGGCAGGPAAGFDMHVGAPNAVCVVVDKCHRDLSWSSCSASACGPCFQLVYSSMAYRKGRAYDEAYAKGYKTERKFWRKNIIVVIHWTNIHQSHNIFHANLNNFVSFNPSHIPTRSIQMLTTTQRSLEMLPYIYQHSHIHTHTHTHTHTHSNTIAPCPTDTISQPTP